MKKKTTKKTTKKNSSPLSEETQRMIKEEARKAARGEISLYRRNFKEMCEDDSARFCRVVDKLSIKDELDEARAEATFWKYEAYGLKKAIHGDADAYLGTWKYMSNKAKKKWFGFARRGL